MYVEWEQSLASAAVLFILDEHPVISNAQRDPLFPNQTNFRVLVGDVE